MTRSYAVIGLGATGLSCVAHLVAQGQPVALIDSRSAPPQLAAFEQSFAGLVPTHFGSFDTPLLQAATDIIISPGVSLQTPEIQAQIAQGKAVYGDIELLARALQNLPTQVIAITGTNGKSTVTAWLEAVLQRAGHSVKMGGNFGIPALTLIAQSAPDYLVLELSSFQLETIFSLQTEVSVFLNISPDHLDRHGSLEAYIQAKQRIFQHAKIAIYNAADTLTYPIYQTAKRLSFGLGMAADYVVVPQASQAFLYAGETRILDVEKMALTGAHNIENALAVLACADALNLPQQAIREALRDFSGLAHRGECVHYADQIAWYNNSKATNVGATISAVQSLGALCQGDVILIAGGQSKGADLSLLQAPVKAHVRTVIVFGEDAPKLEQALSQVCTVHRVADLPAAVAAAKAYAKAEDAVLLAPACASFDMFENFEQRGTLFTRAVKALYP